MFLLNTLHWPKAYLHKLFDRSDKGRVGQRKVVELECILFRIGPAGCRMILKQNVGIPRDRSVPVECNPLDIG